MIKDINMLTFIHIIIIVLAIGILIFFYKTTRITRITKIIFSSLITLIAISIILVPHLSKVGYRDHFDKVELPFANSLENLSIETENNKKILFDNINNLVIEDNIKYYHPVYIKDLGHFYIIIYSLDITKDYYNGYFLQADYEYNEGTDRIVILSKENGKFIIPRVYDIIGKYIDLTRIKGGKDTIGLPVLKPFTDNILYIYTIIINPMFNDDDVKSQSIETISGYSEIDDKGDFITEYIITESFGIITLNNDFDVVHTQHKPRFSNSYITLNKSKQKLLEDEGFVKNGYIKLYNHKFYYLANDMKLYYLENDQSIYVQDVATIGEWDEIFTSDN